jgi:lipid-A-disaccharide synthase-like uncharacterized protein
MDAQKTVRTAARRDRSVKRAGCFIALICLLALPAASGADDGPQGVIIKLKVKDVTRIHLFVDDAGAHRYRLTMRDGRVEELSSEEFSRRLYRDYTSRSAIERLFNITSPIGIAWVVLGFLGQICFTGRMLIQWMVSEKEKRSTVPVVFWWLSLLGGLMLLIYFIWRKDIVGIVGQSTGVFIYTRNLVLISRHRQPTEGSASGDTA